MNTKKYLQQAFYLNQLIETNKYELERLRELSVSVQSPNLTDDRVQTSAPTDKIGETVARIVDLEVVILSDIDRYVKTKKEIRKVLSGVKDDKLKLILQKRYLNFDKWEKIAEDMNLEVRWVYILHKDALKAVEKKKSSSSLNITIEV